MDESRRQSPFVVRLSSFVVSRAPSQTVSERLCTTLACLAEPINFEPVAVDTKVQAPRQPAKDRVDVAALECRHRPAMLADHMMLVATLIAVGSGVLGLYISYYFEVSSGAAIVLACTACFAIAWLIRLARSRG